MTIHDILVKDKHLCKICDIFEIVEKMLRERELIAIYNSDTKWNETLQKIKNEDQLPHLTVPRYVYNSYDYYYYTAGTGDNMLAYYMWSVNYRIEVLCSWYYCQYVNKDLSEWKHLWTYEKLSKKASEITGLPQIELSAKYISDNDNPWAYIIQDNMKFNNFFDICNVWLKNTVVELDLLRYATNAPGMFSKNDGWVEYINTNMYESKGEGNKSISISQCVDKCLNEIYESELSSTYIGVSGYKYKAYKKDVDFYFFYPSMFLDGSYSTYILSGANYYYFSFFNPCYCTYKEKYITALSNYQISPCFYFHYGIGGSGDICDEFFDIYKDFLNATIIKSTSLKYGYPSRETLLKKQQHIGSETSFIRLDLSIFRHFSLCFDLYDSFSFKLDDGTSNGDVL